jgi:hypothetical protein
MLKSFNQIEIIAYVLVTLFVFSNAFLGQAKGNGSSSAANDQETLAQMPRPWVTEAKPHIPTLEEYLETMAYWADKYSSILKVEKRGVAKNKPGQPELPIYLVKITDASVSDKDKQVILFTGFHSGSERLPAMALLDFIEWMTSDDPKAVETRKKQIVLVMPIMNPYSFFSNSVWSSNIDNNDVYSANRGKCWDVATLTILEPEKNPEIVAYKSVVDEYKPEVHFDAHGISPGYAGQTMFESVGSAASNFSLRPWDWRITEELVKSAREQGFPSWRVEATDQRALGGAALESQASKLSVSRPSFYTALYGYFKYHTMPLTCEIGWGESGLSRFKAMLNIGNNVWSDEPYAGYPVDTLEGFINHYVRAWGENSQLRRKSREELWTQEPRFTMGFLAPETVGYSMFVFAPTDQGLTLINKDKEKFVQNLTKCDDYNISALKAFVEAGPPNYIATDTKPKEVRSTVLDQRIQNGLSMQIRIPFLNPKIVDLRLNGHPVNVGKSDGYEKWQADGWTIVQVNIPPAKSKKMDLFIVTCAYDPQEKRSTGWIPPLEVQKKLKAKK